MFDDPICVVGRAGPGGGAGGVSRGSQRWLKSAFRCRPKDNEPRTIGLSPELLTQLTTSITDHHLDRDHLLFATRDHAPRSRGTPSAPASGPKASGIGFNVRIHDLRHAHVSWLLAGGSDLRSVTDRLGHTQIQTTQKYLHALPAMAAGGWRTRMRAQPLIFNGRQLSANWSVVDRLGEIAVPTLVIAGRDDFVFPQSASTSLRTAFRIQYS